MRQRRFFIWVMLTVTAVLLFVLLTDALPWLRGPAPDTSVWHWPYLLRPFSRWWPSLAAAALFLGVLGYWLSQKLVARWQTAVILITLFASSLALQWGLLYADNPQPHTELINRTLAVQTNGYFWTAANISEMNGTLQNYPAAMTRFESDHTRTHPPGLVVVNWLTLKLLQKSPDLAQKIAQTVTPSRCTDVWLLDQSPATAAGLGIWAVLPLLLGAAAVFPAYWLAKSLSRNAAAAKWATLAAVLPALLLFTPLPDPFFATLTLFIVAMFVYGWRQQKKGWLFLAGLLLSFATFLSLGNVALLILIGSYILLMIWQKRPSASQIMPQIISFGGGLSAVWLLYGLGWGVSPWEIVRVGLGEHAALVAAQRSYSSWLIFNPLDLAMFTGFPAIVAFLAAVLLGIRRYRQKLLSEAQAMALSTAVLILILTLSGSTRGEVGRIWLFFMPLMLISGGIWLVEWLPSWRGQWAWAGMQLAWAVVLGLSWQPVQATIVVAERPLFPDMPSQSSPINAYFGTQIRLTQAAVVQTDDVLTVTLAWQAEDVVQRPYTVFNHLLDAEGNLVAQADGWPVNGQWPPTCWQANEPIIDPYQITLPSDLSPGVYTLQTGLYDARDGVRLITVDGADALPLTTITLPVAPTTTSP